MKIRLDALRHAIQLMNNEVDVTNPKRYEQLRIWLDELEALLNAEEVKPGLTVIEALLLSQENGKSYMRVDGGGGFVSWNPDFLYQFDTQDLIADDWECVDTGIPKLTGGRFEAATSDDDDNAT